MRLEDWGLIEYESSVGRQLAAVEEVAAGGEERIVFCSHPPVVTLGRGAVAEDLVGWSGALVESSRGGRATYHGPNQLVIYPILDLRRADPPRDVHAYLRRLESATIELLRELGLPAVEARTSKVGEVSLTGVWAGDHKLASIGIAVRKWITYHGVAVNLLDDASAFQGIRPCGFAASVMSSVEKELGRRIDKACAQDLALRIYSDSLAGASGKVGHKTPTLTEVPIGT
jgi:lipoate-protein ligase B